MKELSRRGHEVIALSPRDKYTSLLIKSGFKHVNLRISPSRTNFLMDFILLIDLYRHYKRIRPNIIQHFTIKPIIYGTIAARLVRIRNVYNAITGLGYIFAENTIHNRLLRALFRCMCRKSIPFSKHVFFQNKEDRDYFVKHEIIDIEKTSILAGSGVDTKFFSPPSKKIKGLVTFILISRMLEDKGIRYFVNAAYKIRRNYENSRFWLLGPLDLQHPKAIGQKQLAIWNEEGIVQYLGRTNNVKRYLAEADVFVFPSYYGEGIPLCLIEAAAMALPIITTDHAGCREVVIDGENGFLVPIKDVNAITKAMDRLLNNPELIITMGNASRKLAIEKFDAQQIINQILHQYMAIHANY